jgi:hypothetical protein
MNPLIKSVLELDRWSDHYQVQLSPGDMNECAHHLDHELGDLVDKINYHSPTMDYGPDNPNTGKHFHTFKIGNEHSRVLYVEYIKICNDTADYDRLHKIIEALATIYYADEFSVEEDDATIISFRIWWN